MRLLRRDQDWAKANPAKAAELDAWVDADVEATRDLHSIDGILRFQVGRKYIVEARWLDRLIVYDPAGQLTLSVKVEWVKRCDGSGAARD